MSISRIIAILLLLIGISCIGYTIVHGLMLAYAYQLGLGLFLTFTLGFLCFFVGACIYD